MAGETLKVAVWAPLDLSRAGGVEVHILELSKALRRWGVEVEIFTNEGSDEFCTLEQLKDYDFDIIHTQGSAFSRRFLGGAGRRKGRQRQVHTLHGVSLDYLLGCRSWLNWRCYTSMLVEGWYSRCADHVIAVSESVKRRAQQCFGLRGDKITVIGNGYNPREFSKGEREEVRRELKFSADDIAVLFVGRGEDKVKGASAVAAALRELRCSYPNLYLLAAPGDGFAEAEWLKKTGPVNYEDMHRYYGAADIFVNASLNEGMPLTVIEAMGAGLAIVAAPAGGIPELITSETPYNNNISMGTAPPTRSIKRKCNYHPQTSLRVPPDERASKKHAHASVSMAPGNACDNKGGGMAPGERGLLLKKDRGDLAEKLERLIKDKPLRRKLGNNAREAVRELTWEHIAQRTIRIYKYLLGKRENMGHRGHRDFKIM